MSLDLGYIGEFVGRTAQLANFFRSMENHEGLREFVVPGKYNWHASDDDESNHPFLLFDFSAWRGYSLVTETSLYMIGGVRDARMDRRSTNSMR